MTRRPRGIHLRSADTWSCGTAVVWQEFDACDKSCVLEAVWVFVERSISSTITVVLLLAVLSVVGCTGVEFDMGFHSCKNCFRRYIRHRFFDRAYRCGFDLLTERRSSCRFSRDHRRGRSCVSRRDHIGISRQSHISG